MPGSGKTKIGRLLSQQTGLDFYDLDAYIVDREGCTINDIFERKGEQYFRTVERDCLRAIDQQADEFVLATGGGAPCFYHNMEYMNTAGITVFLDVPVGEIAERMVRKGTRKRPLLKNISKDILLDALWDKYRLREPHYAQAHIRIGDGLGMINLRVQKIEEELRRLKK